MLFAPPEPALFPPAHKLSNDAKVLRDAYARYACFAQAVPTFRSREFAKICKEAGLMDATFNIRPPNRVDFVYTYACVQGPGGHRNNKTMSLEAFAFASKGVAHETGRPHEEVLRMLADAEPLLNATESPGIPVSSQMRIDLSAKAVGEDEWTQERLGCSPLVQSGVLATYSSYLTKRDAEQAALSAASHHGPPSRTPRVLRTPEWGAYSSPDRRRIARRLAWPGAGLEGGARPMLPPPGSGPRPAWS